MRYMLLIYSTEGPDGMVPDDAARVMESHRQLMAEAANKGILAGAEPLAPTSTATTVRVRNGKPMVIDGPFAETKEQLAGYSILACANLDEAIDWAARIPTACNGNEGCIEIRPMRFQRPPAGPSNG